MNINILVADRIEDLLVAEELRRQLYSVGFVLKVTKLSSENYNIAINKETFEPYDLLLYSVDENPNYTTPSVRNILSYGGVQLYQRSMVYILSRPDAESTIEPYAVNMSSFVPPSEGPISLFSAE